MLLRYVLYDWVVVEIVLLFSDDGNEIWREVLWEVEVVDWDLAGVG